MLMRKKIFIGFILLCTFHFSFPQNIDFRNYTIKEGLAQNTVTYILQDSKGYMWFGTQLGVSRFDGDEFKNYKMSEGLPNNYILTLFEDQKHHMWIGTRGGVSRFDGSEFENYSVEDGLVSNHIKHIEQLDNGSMVFASNQGLSIFDGDSFVNYTPGNPLPKGDFTRLYKDSEGNIWGGLNGGLVRVTEDSVKVFTGEQGFPEEIVWDITGDQKGRVWIATQGGGLYEYQKGVFTHYTTDDGLPGNLILSLHLDPKGNLWTGTYNSGVAKFDGNQFETIKDESLDDKIILEINEDLHGNLWFRSARSGIFEFSGDELRNFTEKNNLIENYSDRTKGLLRVDREGNLWIGTLSGVSKYGKAIFEHYTDEHGLAGTNILAVSARTEEDVWVSSYEALMHYDGDSFKLHRNLEDIYCIYSESENRALFGSKQSIYTHDGNSFKRFRDTSVFSAVDDYIHDIHPGENGTYWLATDKGLVTFKDGVFRQKALDSLEARSVAICDHTVWVATTNGVYHYHPEKGVMKEIHEEDGLPHPTCVDITHDDKNCGVWVGTDNGLAYIQPSDYQVKVYSTQNGMHSNSIYLVQKDQKGHLWAGHEKGIEKIDPENEVINHYGPKEGFYPLETNEGAISMDDEGNLWIGSVDGLVKYVPDNDRSNNLEPRTYIRNLRLFDKQTDFTTYTDSLDPESKLPVNLALPYNKNYLTFEFVGLHYTNPDKVQYKFILEGFDNDWSEPTGERSATYKKIPNGDYTFKVKARNNDGVWNQQPVSFSFTIRPPFWKTWWFYTLIFLVLVFLIVQFVKARERKLIRDKKLLEQKVKERTHEIAKQKEEIEEANEELRTKQKQILTQKDEIQKQRDLAEEQRDQISRQKQEITDSILYAERIQQAVLPPADYCKSILPDHFILFKPRDIVSGDYYWMTQKNNKVIVVAADCTGHGVPGAFMSMLGVSFFNEIVNTMDDLQANLILNRLRYYVKKTLYQTRDDSQTKDGMDLALCIIDQDEQVLQYAGAYNPLYYIRDGELHQIKADRMPIGVHIKEKDTFTNHELKLQPGDVFYIFSDGYVDQFGGEKGRKFKTKPFKRLLTRISDQPMHIQKKELDRTIMDWKGDHDQVDDIIVIGFRPQF